MFTNIAAKLQRSKTGQKGIAIALVAIAYYLSARLAFEVTQLDRQATASVLYPAIGISLATILLLGQQTWIGVLIGATLFGRSLAQVSWITAIVAALGSTFEVLLASQLLKQMNFSRSLHRLKDVLAFTGIGAGLAPMLNATISTVNGYAAGSLQVSDLLNNWLVIWLGDAVSILVFTPVMIIWCDRGIEIPRSWREGLRQFKAALLRRRTIEFCVWLGLMVMCSGLILSVPTAGISVLRGAALPLLEYSPFIFIVWAALRLGQRGAVLCVLIASFVSIWGLAQQFQTRFDMQTSLVHLQVSIATMSIIALVLAAAISERKGIETQLRQRIEQDQFLAESTLRIRRSLDVHEVLSTTVAEVRTYLKADRAHIAVFDSEGFTTVVTESVASGWNPMIGTRSPRPIFEDIFAIFERDSIRVNHNSETSPKSEFFRIYYSMYQVKASIGIPIWQDGRLYGVLNVHQCSAPRHWKASEIELLTRLATQVELAVQQGRLHEKVQGFATDLESQVQDRTAELQQKMIELETLNQVKDTLVHAVTHDLRTPVIGMLMVLKRLQSRADETVSISRSILDRIVESGDRQLNLIRSLLEDYSQESQKLVLNYQLVSLRDLVEQTLQDLEQSISQNRVNLDNQISPDLPPISADSIHLKRVLDNLITNAIIHNPPEIQIKLEAEQIGSELKFVISDNGVGIQKDQCQLLFDKPYLRGSQNQHRTGLGLGLFFCKQIIKAHQGEIGVICSCEGAKFWFTLPL